MRVDNELKVSGAGPQRSRPGLDRRWQTWSDAGDGTALELLPPLPRRGLEPLSVRPGRGKNGEHPQLCSRLRTLWFVRAALLHQPGPIR